jgi:hypothetical protein
MTSQGFDLGLNRDSMTVAKEHQKAEQKARRSAFASANGSTSSLVSRASTQDRHDVVSFATCVHDHLAFILLTYSQMVKYLHKRCTQHKWFEPPSEELNVNSLSDMSGTPCLGVMLRRSPGSYASEPLNISSELLRAVQRLGAPVAFTMSSEITEALFQQITPLQTEVLLDPLGTVLPIANSISDMCAGKSLVSQDAFMCACRQERLVLVWSDSAQGLVAHGTDVETKLVGLVRSPVSLDLEETTDGKFRSGALRWPRRASEILGNGVHQLGIPRLVTVQHQA